VCLKRASTTADSSSATRIPAFVTTLAEPASQWTRNRACPTTFTPTERGVDGKEQTDFRPRPTSPHFGLACGARKGTPSGFGAGQRGSSADRHCCRLWGGSGRRLGGGPRPGPSNAVPYRDGSPSRVVVAVVGGVRRGGGVSLLVAERRQEIAGGFQVGLFDFGDGIGLHRENQIIRKRTGKEPRDTMSRGRIQRLSFRRGKTIREVTSNCRTGSGDSVNSLAKVVSIPG
jgi:hypothetical protein